MLDNIRVALYVALAFVAFTFYQAWVKEHPPQVETPPPAAAAVVATRAPTHLPTSAAAVLQKSGDGSHAPAATQLIDQPVQQGQLINVHTDVMQATIDTLGGDIVGTEFLKYPLTLKSTKPYVLLNDDAATRYIAESGLLSKAGPDTSAGQALYTIDNTVNNDFALQGHEQTLQVNLSWHNEQGLKIRKIYTFTRGSYEIDLKYEIENRSPIVWTGNLYTQLMRTNSPPPSQGGLINLATFFGAAYATPEKPFTKVSFKEMNEKNLNQQVQGGWAAMMQHYFISAWVPAAHTTANYYSNVTHDGLYTIGMIGEPLTVAPGQTLSAEAKLYSGPAIADLLEKTAPGLKLTIDYGWFWFISGIIFWMMQKIYDVVHNWGWSIVLVTIVIKLIFYKLSAKSYRSMSMMKKMQPKLQELKERYGSDKQKMTQATLELYRKEKVNPMSGCLPILIQIPVFIALYWVLVESVQLRQAPFMLWIHDLSQHDPYYILPVLMGISMFVQQRLNPPPPDPLQAKLMMLMPVVFTAMFANFPAGLMLYWFVNNSLSVLQQWLIMRSL